MDYRLDDGAKQRWHTLVTRQRGSRGLVKVERAMGKSAAMISRFENGAESVLAHWFSTDIAAAYASAIGVSRAELEQWLEQARGTAAASEPWHQAFPDVTLEQARLSPRLSVFGLPEPIVTDVPALIDRLRGIKTPLTVRVRHRRGVGRSTVISWLLAAALPSNILMDLAPTGAPRSGGARLGLAAQAPEVVVELEAWTADQVKRLGDRLFDLEELDEDDRERVDRVVARLRSAALSVSPSTAIGLLGAARKKGAAGEGDIVLEIADAQWALVTCRDDFDATDSTWLFRFWAERRLRCPGQSWTHLTRDEAIAVVRAVSDEGETAPLDRRTLRATIAALPASAKKPSLEKALADVLGGPSAEEVIDAMLATELLVEERGWLTAQDPQLAEAFAAEGLQRRVAEIAADDGLGWALDPSWRSLLTRLGALGANPTALIARWRAESLSVRVHGAVALAHFLGGGAQSTALAPQIREVHAAALWALLAMPHRHSDDRSPLFNGLQLRDPTRVMRAVSERQAAVLGFFEPPGLEALARRVPTDIRSLSVGAGFLASVFELNDVPAAERFGIELTSLSPWQCAPVDLAGWRRWSAARMMSSGPDIGAEVVLVAAHRHGHPLALPMLAGASAATVDDEGPEGQLVPGQEGDEADVERDVGIVPHRPDLWRGLDEDVRCQWVGEAGSKSNTVQRFTELVTTRASESVAPLIAAAERLGAAIIDDVVARLLKPGPPDEFLPATRPVPWAVSDLAHARLCVRLATAAGAKGTLAEINKALEAHVSRQIPLPDPRAPQFGLRRPEELSAEELAGAESLIRGVAQVGAPAPGWVRPASQLIAMVLRWETVRQEIALALGDQRDFSLLRRRAMEGPGWGWSAPGLGQLDLALRLWGIASTDRPLSLADLAGSPAPESDAVVLLQRLRERGLERSKEWKHGDDGTRFPAASLAGPPKYSWERPRWVADIGRQLEHLPEISDGPLGAQIRQSISVIAWLFCDGGMPQARRDDIAEPLWVWMGHLAGVHGGSSPARQIVGALDQWVRTRSATELIRRRDPEFIAALSQEVEDVVGLQDPLAGARDLLLTALTTDAPLRRAVWTHAKSEGFRWSALRAEQSAARGGRMADWAQAKTDALRAREREKLLTDADPLQTVAEALAEGGPFGEAEAEALVADWWKGPELLLLPRNVFFHRGEYPFSRGDLLKFVSRSLRAGSRVFVPSLRALWDHLLALPITGLRTARILEESHIPSSAFVADPGPLYGEGVSQTLPASLSAPEDFESVVELIKLLPEAGSVLRAAWCFDDAELVGPSALDLAGYFRSYAECGDDVPVRRDDLRRCWLLQTAPELLDPTVLVVQSANPGLLRMALRARLWQTEPEELLPWIRATMSRCGPDWTADLWIDWSQLEPREAWAWLRERVEADDAEQGDILRLASEVVDLVEHAVPGARRWVVERSSGPMAPRP